MIKNAIRSLLHQLNKMIRKNQYNCIVFKHWYKCLKTSKSVHLGDFDNFAYIVRGFIRI